MKASYVQRLRLTFRKEGNTRYISHLDLARALERAFNRVRLPIAYSQGFNRRPRMQLAAALPLGFSSDCEWVDIWLTEKMDPATVNRRVMAKMAPGIVVYMVQEIPLSSPALQNLISEASYVATLLDPLDETEIQARVDRLLQAPTHIRQRKQGRKLKTYDLRPLIIDLSVVSEAQENLAIGMRLHLKPGLTGRPDEVLSALGLDPHDAHVRRTEILLADHTNAAESLKA